MGDGLNQPSSVKDKHIQCHSHGRSLYSRSFQIQTLRNLANIMAIHEDLLASALNLDRGRISRYCRTVDPRFLERLNRRKPSTMADLADIWYGSQNADYGSAFSNKLRNCFSKTP